MFAVLNKFKQREFILILGLSVFAVTALLFTFLVLPALKTYMQVAKTQSGLSGVVDDSAKLMQQLSVLQADIEVLERRLHGDMASLPEKEIEAHIVGKLQQISWQNGVTLVGIEPSPGDTVESFRELLFQVKLVGEYLDLYHWLREVGDELGFVLIKRYEMQAVGDTAKNPPLAVTLTMSTYRALR